MQCVNKSLKLLTLCLAILTAGFSCVQRNQPISDAKSRLTGNVVSVIDGDSLRVETESGKKEVRLHGIDCPEFYQRFGKEAKAYMVKEALGRQVELEVVDKDRYERLVVVVTRSDGKVLNEELTRVGLAWWYRKHAPNNKILARFESDAKRQGLGLWQDSKPTPPWIYREQKRQKK